MYVTVRSKGLYIFNVANPASAEFISELPVKGNAESICVDSEVLYIGSLAGPVSIYDISASLSPVLYSTVNDHGDASGLSVHNGTLVIADQKKGVLVYDASNPKLPEIIAQKEGHVHSVWYDGEYVYAGTEDGLLILKLVNGEH